MTLTQIFALDYIYCIDEERKMSHPPQSPLQLLDFPPKQQILFLTEVCIDGTMGEWMSTIYAL